MLNISQWSIEVLNNKKTGNIVNSEFPSKVYIIITN